MEGWKLKLRGAWNETRGKIKQAYGSLSDNDLTYEEGKEDEFLGKLQQKTGRAKEDLKSWIDSL